MKKFSALGMLAALALFSGCKTRSLGEQNNAETEAVVDKNYQLSVKQSGDEAKSFVLEVCKLNRTNCYSPLVDQQGKPYKFLAFTKKDLDDLQAKGLLKGAANVGAIFAVTVPVAAFGGGLIAASATYGAGAAAALAEAQLIPIWLVGGPALATAIGTAGLASTVGVEVGGAVLSAAAAVYLGEILAANAVSDKVFSTPFIWGAEERQLAKVAPALSNPDEAVRVPSIKKLLPVIRDTVNKGVNSQEAKAKVVWNP